MFASLHSSEVPAPPRFAASAGSCVTQELCVATFFEHVAANEDGYWYGGELGSAQL
jgi:hypothetical protein